MARERRLGFDTCVLVVGSMAVRLEDKDGSVHAAPLREVMIQDVGEAKPVISLGDRRPGHFLRLKLEGKAFSLYFVPPHATCRKLQRIGSFNYFPQCDERGAEEQRLVASYLSETLARLGAKARDR
jgi:hypothetical protein